MRSIELIGHVDEQHQLRAEVPATVAPGQVKVLVLLPEREDDDFEWPASDLTEDEWRQFVAHGLRNELADPREDVYGDGEGGTADEKG